jgi:hypothetical protein
LPIARWIHRCCLLLCLHAGAAWAQFDPDLVPEPDKLPSMLGPSLADGLDAAQKRWSQNVVNMGHRLDGFFGGEDLERHTEGSMLRLILDTQFDEDGFSYDPRIKLRLRLPNTERRLSLLVRSDEEEEEDLRRGLPVGPRRIDQGDRDYSAVLQFVRGLAEDWRLDVDTGIRLRLPPNPFVRGRVERAEFFGRTELRLSEELYWYRDDGQGARTRLVIQRPLSGPRFLRLDSEADWRQREERWFYSHIGTLLHEFSYLHAISLQLSVTGESEPNQRVTGYGLSLRWRRNVLQRWLFLEVRPEVVYLRENDFEAHPQLIVGLEAFFGDVHWANAPPPDPIQP